MSVGNGGYGLEFSFHDLLPIARRLGCDRLLARAATHRQPRPSLLADPFAKGD
jgi:hypothetical protein